jgi:CheY-like chemotaxis protein
MSNTNKLLELAIGSKYEQFTGKINIQSQGGIGLEWRLYLGLGALIWADGGSHPHRFWQRHLSQYAPHLDFSKINTKTYNQFECQTYYLLTVLLQHNLIRTEQINLIFEAQATEILFDLLQQEEIEPLNYNREPTSVGAFSTYGLKMSLTNINLEKALQQAQEIWSQWKGNGLQTWSPNLAPRLKNLEQLQQEVSPGVYQNFIKFIDGQQSLRDLAVKMNKDLIKLTCSLLPYVRKGFCELIEIPDRKTKILANNNTSTAASNSNTQILSPKQSAGDNKPLIACVDDSLQIGKIMEEIVKGKGYRFIYIQDALQAVPKLIAANPNLIFLDIGMPTINGYEICSQIRRVSKLKDTPVVMLTGNDGIVDRMRAKVVGSSEFVNKPIDINKILNTIEKFMSKELTV